MAHSFFELFSERDSFRLPEFEEFLRPKAEEVQEFLWEMIIDQISSAIKLKLGPKRKLVDGGGANMKSGISEKDAVDLFNNQKLKRISKKKVNEAWIKHRGASAKDPKMKNILHAIKISDANRNGKLEID